MEFQPRNPVRSRLMPGKRETNQTGSSVLKTTTWGALIAFSAAILVAGLLDTTRGPDSGGLGRPSAQVAEQRLPSAARFRDVCSKEPLSASKETWPGPSRHTTSRRRASLPPRRFPLRRLRLLRTRSARIRLILATQASRAMTSTPSLPARAPTTTTSEWSQRSPQTLRESTPKLR